MIELPVDFGTDLSAAASTQIANFSDVLLIVMGLLLSLLAVGALIRFFRH